MKSNSMLDKLKKQIGCPLDVRLKVSLGTSVYIFVNLDMSRQPSITTRREDGTWKLIGDKYLAEVTVLSDELHCSGFEVSMPSFSVPCERFERHDRVLRWKDYNKTWWLSKDWWYKKDTKDWQKW